MVDAARNSVRNNPRTTEFWSRSLVRCRGRRSKRQSVDRAGPWPPWIATGSAGACGRRCRGCCTARVRREHRQTPLEIAAMARGALRDLTGADERLELALALLACVFVQRHSGIVLEPSPTPAPSCENNRGKPRRLGLRIFEDMFPLQPIAVPDFTEKVGEASITNWATHLAPACTSPENSVLISSIGLREIPASASRRSSK